MADESAALDKAWTDCQKVAGKKFAAPKRLATLKKDLDDWQTASDDAKKSKEISGTKLIDLKKRCGDLLESLGDYKIDIQDTTFGLPDNPSNKQTIQKARKLILDAIEGMTKDYTALQSVAGDIYTELYTTAKQFDKIKS